MAIQKSAINPFTPTFGQVPLNMAGRSQIIREMTHALSSDYRSPELTTLIAPERVFSTLERIKLISYAESLGGVESLMTFPLMQTHGAMPQELREKLGIDDRLLRISVGVEDARDLIADLEQALA